MASMQRCATLQSCTLPGVGSRTQLTKHGAALVVADGVEPGVASAFGAADTMGGMGARAPFSAAGAAMNLDAGCR